MAIEVNVTVSGGHVYRPRPGKPHVAELVNQAVSKLAPFSAIILTVFLVIFFLVRFYVFESFLMRKVYGKRYLDLNELNRRGFVNHHVAGAAKLIMLLVAAYPFCEVTFGRSSLHTKFPGSKMITFGDLLLVVSQMFIAMYIFELLYRSKLSPVAVAHHIGATVIAQSAVAMSLNWEHEQDATIEFVLCLAWGAFDVIAELWPHAAIILYRLYPTRHNFLRKVFQVACISSFGGTILETACVMYLFGSLWDRWSLPFKVVTPILHIIFSAAQLWGAWNLRMMWKSQEKKMREKSKQSENVEAASSSVEEVEKVEVVQAEPKK